MNHQARIWIIASILLIALHVKGQIMTITEYDEFGKTHTLVGKGVEDRVVDINSDLEIKIDHGLLRTRMAEREGGTQLDQLVHQMKLLLDIAEVGLKSMDEIRTVLESRRGGTPSLKKQIENDLKKIESWYMQDKALEASIERSLAVAPNSDWESYQAVYEGCASRANDIPKDLAIALDASGHYVQIGAWIATKNGTSPIRIPGLDQFREGDYWRFDRFNFSPTEAQEMEYQQAAEQAKLLNEKGPRELMEAWKNRGEQVFSIMEKDLKAETIVLINSIKDQPALVKLLEEARALEAQIGEILKKYGTAGALNSAEMVLGLLGDAEELKSTLEALKLEIDRVIKNPDVPIEILEKAKKSIDKLKGKWETELEGELSYIRTVISTFEFVQVVSSAGLEFSEKVNKLKASQVPDEAMFSLLTTGERAMGDRIIFKLGHGVGTALPVEMESHQLVISKTLPHISISVGLLFAKGLGDKVHPELKGKFQYAPSYSFLFKPGCRNIRYRRFMDVGIGLNISTLDFDRNETPEIGTAGVLSIFRDYLQGGFGYNFFTNTPYWFAMIRLPLPSVPVKAN